ncbi:MAG: hypothetical protein JWO67_2947 [Streptosporangiaceae bacterium]|nr:hypothetical protein [Streptosporangiaceae bacterium]
MGEPCEQVDRFGDRDGTNDKPVRGTEGDIHEGHSTGELNPFKRAGQGVRLGCWTHWRDLRGSRAGTVPVLSG